ncbi:MAG: hypothetical protein F4Y00_10150 [Bacteroidetes bacterium SB0662_bin_6]|nr:hypothetical protein [Bacteroidetes bacterium SB0662_bin_6]
MKNYVWKHRIVLVLLAILFVQVPFVMIKLTTADRDVVSAIAEAAQILFSSGLAGYLFSKTFESWLEKKLYGGFRRNWKEVRVMYSDGVLKGMGEAYPREPTLLIQPPIFDDARPESPRGAIEEVLFAQSRDGRKHTITAPIMHGPVSISFNTGYVRRPGADENTWATGHWSEMQLMQVGYAGQKITRVGFPDTLVQLARAKTG